MGDLISRKQAMDNVRRYLREYKHTMAGKVDCSEILYMLGDEVQTPTAYDVYKVVEQLESRLCTEDMEKHDIIIARRNAHFREAIEIVRAGEKEPFPSSGSGRDI